MHAILFYNCQQKILFGLDLIGALSLVTKFCNCLNRKKNSKRCISNICKNCLLYWLCANKIRGLQYKKQEENT